jgi:hypothetical protein
MKFFGAPLTPRMPIAPPAKRTIIGMNGVINPKRFSATITDVTYIVEAIPTK